MSFPSRTPQTQRRLIVDRVAAVRAPQSTAARWPREDSKELLRNQWRQECAFHLEEGRQAHHRHFAEQAVLVSNGKKSR